MELLFSGHSKTRLNGLRRLSMEPIDTPIAHYNSDIYIINNLQMRNDDRCASLTIVRA